MLVAHAQSDGGRAFPRWATVLGLACLWFGLAPLTASAQTIFEFGLIVCQQQPTGGPLVVLSSVRSSELLIPVATLDLAEELPPDEGRSCAEVLSDLTRENYELLATTPVSKRFPTPQQGFLERLAIAAQRLQWTIKLRDSVALMTCDPLADQVIDFSDGASPSEYFVPAGASCAVHLAAILARGGEIVGRSAVTPASDASPTGAVEVYTAYELVRTIDADLPRLPRSNQGRSRDR